MTRPQVSTLLPSHVRNRFLHTLGRFLVRRRDRCQTDGGDSTWWTWFGCLGCLGCRRNPPIIPDCMHSDAHDVAGSNSTRRQREHRFTDIYVVPATWHLLRNRFQTRGDRLWTEPRVPIVVDGRYAPRCTPTCVDGVDVGGHWCDRFTERRDHGVGPSAVEDNEGQNIAQNMLSPYVIQNN